MRDRTELRAAAIHLAAFNGNITLMKYLLKNNADLTLGTAYGVSALHMAAQGDQPSSLDMLLNYKQSPSTFEINQRDSSGATPLIWATFCGSENALCYILAQPEVDIDA